MIDIASVSLPRAAGAGEASPPRRRRLPLVNLHGQPLTRHELFQVAGGEDVYSSIISYGDNDHIRCLDAEIGDVKGLNLNRLALTRLLYPDDFHSALAGDLGALSAIRCELGGRLPAAIVDSYMVVIASGLLQQTPATIHIQNCTTGWRKNAIGRHVRMSRRCGRRDCPRCAYEEAKGFSDKITALGHGLHSYLVTLSGGWLWHPSECRHDFRSVMLVFDAAHEALKAPAVERLTKGCVFRHEFAFPVMGTRMFIKPHTHAVVLSEHDDLSDGAAPSGLNDALTRRFGRRLIERWDRLPVRVKDDCPVDLSEATPDVQVKAVAPGTELRTLSYILKPLSVLGNKHYGAAMAQAETEPAPSDLLRFRRELNESAHQVLETLHHHLTHGRHHGTRLTGSTGLLHGRQPEGWEVGTMAAARLRTEDADIPY